MAKVSLALCLLLLVALSEVYEVQGTFLLRHYMRKFPRRSRDFRPFACNGMLMFVNVLERKCPLRPQYKNFFGNLKSYMNFINSASGSKNFDVELKGKAEGLNKAMSAMSGKGGSSGDSSKVMDVLLSMGKTLGEQKNSGSTMMTMGQRKELIMSMAKWARTIGQFVASAAAKSGNSIDMSSLGLDVDANAATGTGDSSASSETSATGTGSPTASVGDSSTGTGGSATASGSYMSGNTNTGGSASAGGSTSSCKTSECSNGGGNSAGGSSFKGSVSAQSQQSASGSQQTSFGSSN